ncbi:hypothetical protein [Microbacterium sp. HJ5]
MSGRRSIVPVLAVVVAGLALSACAADDSSTEGGFALPRLPAAEAASIAPDAAPVDGALQVGPNGCFLFAVPGDSAAAAHGTWIVWPETAEQDGGEVVLAGGTRLGDGDAIVGSGEIVELAELPDGATSESYFGSFGRFCGADRRRVLVLTDLG